jgi:soluble lytic murein transglycosylase-like protein
MLCHEKMIAYANESIASRNRGRLVYRNKKVYICFPVAVALSLTMMAASPMRAADAAGSIAASPVSRTTIVVKADPRTGRLVRSAVVRDTPAPVTKKAAVKPTQEISDLVDKSARAHQVDPLLVHSIIKTESNYNAYAISNKGAEGLMQLMPPTARMLGVTNSFDPRENIEAGVKYLKYLQGVFKDDRLALAAYNAGPANVEKYKQVPPFKETQNYVEQVGKRYDDARRAAGPVQKPVVDAALPEPSLIEKRPLIEKHPKLEQFVDEHGRLSLRTIE